MTPPSSPPPRGWYPDPAGGSAWRWWDGQRWTEHLEPYARPLSAEVAPLLEREQRAGSRLLPAGLILIAIAVVLGTVVRAFESSYLTATWHWFRQALTLAEQGKSTSAAGNPPVAPTLAALATNLIVLPLEIVGLVLLLTFQHRAASAARALGLPQRLSPTFGVVSWFIPFAVLVLPWMAWQDLLPRTDPRRQTMTAIWLLALASGALGLAGLALLLVSTFLAGLASAAELIAALLALRLAPGVIEAVLDAHRSGAGSSPAAVRDLLDGL